MAAGKKNGKYLNVCIDAGIYDRLATYCEAVGQKKTAAVERILTDYLDRFDDAVAVLSSSDDEGGME